MQNKNIEFSSQILDRFENNGSFIVTAEDRKNFKTLKKLNTRKRVYWIIIFGDIIAIIVIAILEGKNIVDPNDTYIKLATAVCFILLVLMIILSINPYQAKKYFKEKFVNPLLIFVLGYHDKASRLFCKKFPLSFMFKEMNLNNNAFYDEISDCILGEVQSTKFALVNVEFFNIKSEYHSHVRDTVFKGQVVIAPIKNRQCLPKDFVPDFKLQESIESNLVHSLSDVFNDSWKADKSRPSSVNMDSFAPSNNFGTLTSFIEYLSTKGIVCKYYCLDNMFIFIAETSKILFEYDESLSEIETVKQNIVKDVVWCRTLIDALIGIGLI